MFDSKDLDQMSTRGMDPQVVQQQIENFKTGFPFANLQSAATVNHGITKFSENEIHSLATDYKEKSATVRTIKFVPASGAASRMFKDLFAFSHSPSLDHKKSETLRKLDAFAFGHELKILLEKDGVEIDENDPQSLATVANYILDDRGLNYGHLPKGLILFHKYDDAARTAFEEHLIEAAEYSADKNNIARLHFTVSPDHQEKIESHINEVAHKYEEKLGVTFDISFSAQKASTDTIAVNLDNTPFRNSDDSILFRPGGHGALIANLNDLLADIVFIKNIDNVVPDQLKNDTYTYKKGLGTHLINIREQVFEALQLLENNEGLETSISLAKTLGVEVLSNETPQSLHNKLNRPIRICGMVKNEGEPGGGPFWVKNSAGITSLQIIESSQIDTNNDTQHDIVEGATHFNPVDLICSITDYKGQHFDLNQFIDPETGFISSKSKDGKELKAQELPGLWNGAMANWITLFVEVPVSTFNPVKTLNDLLRKEHCLPSKNQ